MPPTDNTAFEKCYCTAPSFASRWKQADAVFTGTVTQIQTIRKYAVADLEYTPVTVTLTIDKSYKGADKDEAFVLTTSMTKENCNGFPFQQGQGYLVFAYRQKEGHHDATSSFVFPEGTYNIGGLCGGIKKITEAAEDLENLEEIDR